jgi:beta-N-acetylhexosaminidase
MSAQSEWVEDSSEPAPDSDYARNFAATSATVVAPECGVALVGASAHIEGGWPDERQALADALAAHGVSEGGDTTIRLVGSASGTGNADVVVAMGGPWGLPASQASVYVGLYGRSHEALAGLADLLVGQVESHGGWPVPGMPGTPCR